ncbi:MAG: hypothetical protein ACQETL_19215 [Bacteroidota bacterium]
MNNYPEIKKKSKNEVLVSASYSKAFAHLEEAINKIGSVKEKNKDEQFIKSKIKYGLNSVKVRSSLVERGKEETTILIQASSNDIGSTAEENVTERLIETLTNLDNPGYEPDKRGVSTAAIIGSIILLIIIVLIVNAIIL